MGGEEGCSHMGRQSMWEAIDCAPGRNVGWLCGRGECGSGREMLYVSNVATKSSVYCVAEEGSEIIGENGV